MRMAISGICNLESAIGNRQFVSILPEPGFTIRPIVCEADGRSGTFRAGLRPVLRWRLP